MGKADAGLAIFSSFGLLSLLLLLGKVLRTTVKPLRALYLPSSVVGGFLGLLLGYTCQWASPASVKFIQAYLEAGWAELPAILINAIFASVFIGVEVPPLRVIWEASGPQIAYGQIVTHGLWAGGLLLGWLVMTVQGKGPDYYGVMLYVGFEGGHGTVGGLQDAFSGKLNWAEGKDVCLASATAGLVGSTLVGVALVNAAHRMRWLASSTPVQSEEAADPLLLVGIYSPDNRPPMGFQTVIPDSIDTLTLHFALLGLAVFFGYLAKRGMLGLESLLGSYGMQGLGSLFSAFPLFPLCMLGGIAVQLITKHCLTVKVVDHSVMQRLSGLALDFLVCAAIAKMELSAMSGSIGAFLVLVVFGIFWHLFCLLVLAKPLLPDAWFERGIFEVGHSMGTTANGILLLKMADSRGETSAHSATAFKLMVHEPLMGLWLAVVISSLRFGPLPAMTASLVALVLWLLLLQMHFRPRYRSATELGALAKSSSDFLLNHRTRAATTGVVSASPNVIEIPVRGQSAIM